jgi:hypothetical protein
MVFNATFNNISVISWRLVLLLDETSVLGQSLRPVANHWQTCSYNVVSSTARHERDSNSQLLWWWALITNPTTIRSRPCLFWRPKLVPMRFDLDRCHCINLIFISSLKPPAQFKPWMGQSFGGFFREYPS